MLLLCLADSRTNSKNLNSTIDFEHFGNLAKKNGARWDYTETNT